MNKYYSANLFIRKTRFYCCKYIYELVISYNISTHILVSLIVGFSIVFPSELV